MKSPNPGAKEIESPTGLDLNPHPPSPVRLSKRAGILALVVVFAGAALVGYGIITRSNHPVQVGFQPDGSKLTAATDAGKVIAAQIPTGAAFVATPGRSSGSGQDELHPPGQTPAHQAGDAAGRGQYASVSNPGPPNVPQYREPTAEEKRLALAYEREMQARDSPTLAQAGGGAGFGHLPVPGSSGSEGVATQLASLFRSAQPAAPLTSAAVPANSPLPDIGLGGQPNRTAEGYEAQNMQDHKEAFLARARASSEENYLNSTRTKPASPYEIKAGWDIPAILEQGLNSDLPGEIKALVRENVYDTATGKYLLIPQGARLVGTYDSHIAYGQNGIQVVWNRIIFPDGSSINLEGMVGQDPSGYAGLRDKVDNHYKRLFGFALLTSLFSASFQLSQSRSGSVLVYPTPSEIAGSAVGAQVSQLGADITRRNLNIQPTIKVPVGYRFNVRVNRDILFESPFQPLAG